MDRDEYFVVNGRALHKSCSKAYFLEILVLIRKLGALLGFAKKIDSRGCLYHFMESNVHQKQCSNSVRKTSRTTCIKVLCIRKSIIKATLIETILVIQHRSLSVFPSNAVNQCYMLQ